MLKLYFPESEAYDESKNEFVYYPERTIYLEHSLVSISKWEAKWHKPFFENDNKNDEEILDYIKCMTVTSNVPDELYGRITNSQILKIKDYINDPMTATTFFDFGEKETHRKKIITSEEIYYAMVAHNIPFDPCQKWHINRLLTLIRIANIRSNPNKKKMSKNEQLSRQRSLNAQRKAKYNTKG